MTRRRSSQLNVRLRPALADAFDASLADLPWSKVFIVERLIEAFTKMDRTQRDRLLLSGRVDAPEFVDHAWRVIGEEALRMDAAPLFEVLYLLTNAAVYGGTGPIWDSLEAARQKGPIGPDNAFMHAVRLLTFAPVQPHSLKVEVLRGMLLLADSGLSPADAVERLRAARTT